MTEEERKEYHRQYYLKNKEKIAEQRRQYYLKNKEKAAEQTKQYYIKNKDKFVEYQKQYYYTKYVFQLELYFRRNYSRYITLENYISISKNPIVSLKRSVMVRLSRGFIDQHEAVEIAGMPLTDKDHELIQDALKSIKKIN